MSELTFANPEKLLGEYTLAYECFDSYPVSQDRETFFFELLSLIQQAPPSSFLLPAILKILHGTDTLTFCSFENWLSQTLPFEQLRSVKGKIAGQYIPRNDYQCMFPVGQNHIYDGIHIVSAHRSPDTDTCIASFWGWLDAFACHIAHEGHLWNVPGGQLPFDMNAFFSQHFSPYLTDLVKENGADTHLYTYSLRDFSTREEGDLPHSANILSIIDHHRMRIDTSHVPIVSIADVQSVNVLVAEHYFALYDHYSTQGFEDSMIEDQMTQLQKTFSNKKTDSDFFSRLRCLKRLCNKRLASETNQKKGYFIAAQREFFSYLSLIHAIFDDTDLLNKVTKRDLHCVVSLINRMSTLINKREKEVLSLDEENLETSAGCQLAVRKILKHPQCYSLYRPIFRTKEEFLSEQLDNCIAAKGHHLFDDTKQQNGCCRVGQTKIFPNNLAKFHDFGQFIMHQWLHEAKNQALLNPKLQLHIHMISTISGAEQAYLEEDPNSNFTHLDQLWTWFSSYDTPYIEAFFSKIKLAPEFRKNLVSLQVDPLLLPVVESYFPAVPKSVHNKECTIFFVKAGSLNSRKTAITPYLPKINVN